MPICLSITVPGQWTVTFLINYRYLDAESDMSVFYCIWTVTFLINDIYPDADIPELLQVPDPDVPE
jgi:hypothetical protein